MRKLFFIKLVNMAKQLLNNTKTTFNLSIMNSKGVNVPYLIKWLASGFLLC